MITPQASSNKDAAALIDLIANTIVGNIKEGGLESMKSIIIQGSADSATPTTKVPKGFTKLDHDKAGCKNDYCGETDIYKRNQFLADNRAEMMKKRLILEVKNKTMNLSSDVNTTVDISSLIKVEPGVNYYDPSLTPRENTKNRKGEKKVSVIINPVDDKLIPGEKTNKTNSEIIRIVPTKTIGKLKYGNVELEVISDVTDNVGHWNMRIANNDDAKKLVSEGVIFDFSELGKINGKPMIDGEITSEGKVILDGQSWGPLTSEEDAQGAAIQNIITKYSTESKLAVFNKSDTFMELRNYHVSLLDMTRG